jgi:hypothetical protein
VATAGTVATAAVTGGASTYGWKTVDCPVTVGTAGPVEGGTL